MRAYRDIATLSALQILSFLLLTHLEPDSFMLHLYQTIVYEAILLMLFYTEDRWAYMIGILAPAAWLVLAYESGLLGAALRQLFRLTRAGNQQSEPGGWNNCTSLAADDWVLRVPLEAALLRAQKGPEHFSD